MGHRQVRNKRSCLRIDDRGASLIAVIVALIFVITVGAIIMGITMANIRMTGIELSTKNSFYSAEGVMEELKSELAKKAAEQMKLALDDVITADITDLSQLQKEFNNQYMANLAECFSGISPALPPSESYYAEKYDKVKVESVMSGSANVGYLNIPGEDSRRIFTIDYNKGLFTLKNLSVEFNDGIYSTSISTDLVFRTPTLTSASVSAGDMIPSSTRIGDYLTYENWTKNEE